MTDAGGAAAPGGVRVVDLSIPVGPETQIYPGDPIPAVRRAMTIQRDGATPQTST